MTTKTQKYESLFLPRDVIWRNNVDLSANENIYSQMSTYPAPYCKDAIEIIKDKVNEEYWSKIWIDNILITIGAEEAVDLIIRTFTSESSNEVLFHSPAFFIYEHYSILNKVTPIINDIDTTNWKVNFKINEFIEKQNKNSKILFLVNPNNPLPLEIQRKEIIYCLENFNGIVVVDEAYIDFLSAEKSFVKEINNYKNLLVVHTFSKWNNLAWARIWTIYWNKDLIDKLKFYKPPYSTSKIITDFIIKFYSDPLYLQTKNLRIQQVKKNREILCIWLAKVDFIEYILPSCTNFIAIKIKEEYDVDALYRYILSKWFLLLPLYRNWWNVTNMIRISVWKRYQNEKLIKVLKSYKK